MKVFAIISLVMAAFWTVLFGYHAGKGWFNRNSEDFSGCCVALVAGVTWLLTAICLLGRL